MLNVGVLKAKLRRIADVHGPEFAGYPGTRLVARERWAQAIGTYLRDLVVAAPQSVQPKDKSATFDATPSVEGAFREAWDLREGSSTLQAADRLAEAWRAAIDAITLVSNTSDVRYIDGDAGTIITAIQPFGAGFLRGRQVQLTGQLFDLFSMPSLTAERRLDEIANALHLATESLQTTCSYSGVVGQPLTFG